MKILQSSKRIEIPKIFFITNKSEIKDIPIGVPFILGHKNIENDIVRILEYEVLYQNAKKSGYPFNFKQILKDNGFLDLEEFSYRHPTYFEIRSDKDIWEIEDLESFKFIELKDSISKLRDFIRDSACYVNVQKLKDLNVFPVWLSSIEETVNRNIQNFATFNYNLYNKKLEGMYGGIELTSPSRNLIVIDISSSIPKGVSSTTLVLCKNLAESFYADVLITGSKSTLYLYENLHTLDIETIYDENGMDNDQTWFKKLVTSEKKIYETAIVFGDNHNPGWIWSNKYNKRTRKISEKDGKKMCKWEIKKLLSFHTTYKKDCEIPIAGYGLWFSPESTESIQDWVKYL